MTAPFRATHRVAPTGVQAWARPDPDGGVIATLDPNLEVQVVERYGDWAQVLCSNGWGAWVDARCLQAVGAPVRAPAPAVARPVAAPVAARTAAAGTSARDSRLIAVLGACGVAVLGAILPWLKITGVPDDSSGFDVPVKFLFDYKSATNGGLKAGLLVLLIAGAAAAAAAMANASPAIRRVCGGVLALLPVLFLVQVNRLESAAGGGGGLDPGIGVFVTLLAGIAVALLPGRRPGRAT